MKNKKMWLGMLVMVLVFGMSALFISCGQSGGTVTFINDVEVDVTVAVAVGAGFNITATSETVTPGNSISRSISEDGNFAVTGSFMAGTTASVISRSGTLSGGETITIRASDF